MAEAVCSKCRELKIPTTYWCDVNCRGPGAWKRHAPVHKSARKVRKDSEDGGMRQRDRETAGGVRRAAQTGDAYDELMVESAVRFEG